MKNCQESKLPKLKRKTENFCNTEEREDAEEEKLSAIFLINRL
jgi:hypothetical protein